MRDAVLVADIGGTNARLGLAVLSDGRIKIEHVKKYLVARHPNLHDVVRDYVQNIAAKPDSACFAVAGPVTDSQVEFTNSSWSVNIPNMKAAFGFARFHVVNDFYALASGVPQLEQRDFLNICPGDGSADAPTIVMGPGTGLGQALIVPCGAHEKIISTEGGHVAFAPVTTEEQNIAELLSHDHGRVTVEHVLSGRGIESIYQALTSLGGAKAVQHSAISITEAATSGVDLCAVRALDLFCQVLGRVVGDAVLSTGARGGVVLGGGILPKIRHILLASKFSKCFRDKGPMSSFVGDVPVKLIIADDAALRGAAAISTTEV